MAKRRSATEYTFSVYTQAAYGRKPAARQQVSGSGVTCNQHTHKPEKWQVCFLVTIGHGVTCNTGNVETIEKT